MSALALSPTGNHLAVWEGPLEVISLLSSVMSAKFYSQYKLYILSLTGNLLGSFSPDPDPGSGIRNAAWHPSGMFLAIGGWDDKVHSRSINTIPH